MILVTGGAGYIGSHCVLELLKNNLEVVVFDNLSTGHIETVEKLQKIGKIEFIQGDLVEIKDIEKISKYNIDAVMHFAALSVVEESVKNPQKYYLNNVIGTFNLLNQMVKDKINKIVFSSTASTYGEPKYIPIDENHPQKPINTYGNTKLAIENMLDDYDKAYEIKSARLRYFNVIGANEDSIIGEWHTPETHLVPNILKTTFDNTKTFKIFGTDYKTKDGTCVRDYVNVEDLANAHILALKYLLNGGKTDFFNLGTNCGNTVKEIFDICEKVLDKKIKVENTARRQGDPETLLADNKKAKETLGWINKRSLEQSIKSAYNWEIQLNVIEKKDR